MRNLPHPLAHRGPLVAAGALVLTVGGGLEQLRIDPGAGVQLLVAAAIAAVLLLLALREPLEGGRPHVHTSVLVVCGLLAAAVALLRLADVLGGDLARGIAAGTIAWTALAEAGLAAAVSAARRSAIAALIAAVAVVVAVLAIWQELFEPDSITPFRWLLLVLAVAFAVASLPLRAASQRHAEQMVNAAGLAVLFIPLAELPAGLFGGGAAELPGFWELVVLAAGLALVAYAAPDRAPGPAYLGAANLGAFVVLVGLSGDRTLEWWPLLALALGLGALAAGLWPRGPLPAEPDASTRPDDLPPTVRVHRD